MTLKSEWLCFPLYLLWFYYYLQIWLSRLWDVKIGESRVVPWTEFSVDLALMLKLLVFLNNSIRGSLNCWNMLSVSVRYCWFQTQDFIERVSTSETHLLQFWDVCISESFSKLSLWIFPFDLQPWLLKLLIIFYFPIVKKGWLLEWQRSHIF